MMTELEKRREDKLVEEAIKIVVFNNHEPQDINEEWRVSGVTISCGPTSWLVHKPCDPNGNGTVQNGKCYGCNTEVPALVEELFKTKAQKQREAWEADRPIRLPKEMNKQSGKEVGKEMIKILERMAEERRKL